MHTASLDWIERFENYRNFYVFPMRKRSQPIFAVVFFFFFCFVQMPMAHAIYAAEQKLYPFSNCVDLRGVVFFFYETNCTSLLIYSGRLYLDISNKYPFSCYGNGLFFSISVSLFGKNQSKQQNEQTPHYLTICNSY